MNLNNFSIKSKSIIRINDIDIYFKLQERHSREFLNSRFFSLKRDSEGYITVDNMIYDKYFTFLKNLDLRFVDSCFDSEINDIMNHIKRQYNKEMKSSDECISEHKLAIE